MVRQSEGNKAEPAPLTPEQVAAMLHRADIILTHGGGPADRAIQRVTNSYWNHVALVALLSDKASGTEQGYQQTFVLESEANRGPDKRGVDIHPVDKYLYDDRQDIAILRFPDVALGGDCALDFLRRVRGFALEEIDAEYGYGAILGYLAMASGLLGWLLRPIIRAVRILSRYHRDKAINDFICSGVVQYAYYRACFGARPQPGEPWQYWQPFFQQAKNRGNVIVNPRVQGVIGQEDTPDTLKDGLKLTIPADFWRAAATGRLRCVAQRIKGNWQDKFTEV